MNRGKPWFEHLVDDTGELFGYGTVSGSAFYMLKGMYNSPKGECLSRGLQAVRMNVPRFASNFGIFGGLSSVLESSMIYARQKDDPWNSILASAASFGFLRMRRGIGSASRSALFMGLAVAFLEGCGIGVNKLSSVQCPQPDIEELDNK